MNTHNQLIQNIKSLTYRLKSQERDAHSALRALAEDAHKDRNLLPILHDALHDANHEHADYASQSPEHLDAVAAHLRTGRHPETHYHAQHLAHDPEHYRSEHLTPFVDSLRGDENHPEHHLHSYIEGPPIDEDDDSMDLGQNDRIQSAAAHIAGRAPGRVWDPVVFDSPDGRINGSVVSDQPDHDGMVSVSHAPFGSESRVHVSKLTHEAAEYEKNHGVAHP